MRWGPRDFGPVDVQPFDLSGTVSHACGLAQSRASQFRIVGVTLLDLRPIRCVRGLVVRRVKLHLIVIEEHLRALRMRWRPDLWLLREHARARRRHTGEEKSSPGHGI